MRTRDEIVADLVLLTEELAATKLFTPEGEDPSYEQFNKYRLAHDITETKRQNLQAELEMFYFIENDKARYAALQASQALPVVPEEPVV